MAAISSAPAAATSALTSPDSLHDDASWSFPQGSSHTRQREPSTSSKKSPTYAQNGFEPLGPPADRPNRRMQSPDSRQHDHSTNALEDGFQFDTGHVNKKDPGDGEGHSLTRKAEDKHTSAASSAVPGDYDDQSKWIHRDKLAKIESEELQAAGIWVPRSRAPSKQRRDRSQASYRRGTDASERGNSRSRKNSSAVEQRPMEETSPPAWDLRTPEEIAEEEANAYFAANAQKGTSRIPVAKTSLAPISTEYLDRATPAARKQGDSSDGESLAYTKTRSRSASASGKDGLGLAGKRSATDMSPKKSPGGARKTSAPSRPPTTSSTQPGRPKTRSGSNGTGTRPSTRSGEKQPEGDPPWLANTYKPDPRLPPDQQLLPTVARRLQQEQWEKEGKYGDVYDTEFRPLNDNVFLKPEAPATAADEEQQQQADEWPLKPEAVAKSPSLRQGSYSTMPKISDKPPGTPLGSPRPPMTPQHSMLQQTQSNPPQSIQRMQTQEADPQPKKGGCGCCVVM